MNPIFTPETQKNLIILVAATSMRGDASLSSSWLLHRDDAWDWLEARRPFFPGASGQELVSLALIPEDLRVEAAACLCGFPPERQVDKSDLNVVALPDFHTFTSTSAACVLQGTVVGGDKEMAKFYPKFSRMIGKQIKSAFPKALKFEDGFFESLPNREDVEAAMISRRDQIALESIENRAPSRSRKPGL